MLTVTLPASATRNTVVVDEILIRLIIGLSVVVPLVPVVRVVPRYVASGLEGRVAEVVVIPEAMFATTVVATGKNRACPQQFQSPAVREMLVALTVTPLVIAVPVVELLANSPILPAFALSARVVPTIPEVVEGVNVLVDCRVVNLPAAAAVVPIAGGDAKYVENPVPLTVPEADRVVADTLAGVVLPSDGGAAKIVFVNAVVASCVVFVPAPAVGAVGVPVNAGEANGA